MYKIALCDDDIDILPIFEKMLSAVLTVKGIPYCLSTFSCIDSLHQSLGSGEHYDLIFLDVLFDRSNSLQFAKRLRKERRPVDIIFISSSRDYALESYDVSPLHYLMKPIQPEALEAALNRFLDKAAARSLCFTTSKRGLLHIQIADIKYFEIYGHEIIIHTKKRRNGRMLRHTEKHRVPSPAHVLCTPSQKLPGQPGSGAGNLPLSDTPVLR